MTLKSLTLTPQKIMGVDCSTRSFAYAIFDSGEPLRCGEIFFSGKDICDRIASGMTLVSRSLEDGTLEADAVGFESAVMVNSNAQTGIHLAYVYGATIAPLVSAGMKMKLVQPLVWQSYIGNKKLTAEEKEGLIKLHPTKSAAALKEAGRELRKQKTLAIARTHFDIPSDSDNIGDAVGIALWAQSYYAKGV